MQCSRFKQFYNVLCLIVWYLIAISTDIHPEMHFQNTETIFTFVADGDVDVLRYLNTNRNFILSTVRFFSVFLLHFCVYFTAIFVS